MLRELAQEDAGRYAAQLPPRALAVRSPPELEPLDEPLDEPPEVVLGALRGDAEPEDRSREIADEPPSLAELLGHGERFDLDIVEEPDDGWLRV